MAKADQLSRTQMFPPLEKKFCMKPCSVFQYEMPMNQKVVTSNFCPPHSGLQCRWHSLLGHDTLRLILQINYFSLVH